MIHDTIGILASWNLQRIPKGGYSVASTHYVYLKYVCSHYKKIYLITSVRDIRHEDKLNLTLDEFDNIKVVELPEVKSFLSAQMNFWYYYKAIKSVKDEVDLFYCRVPDPFSWIPRLLFSKKSILHFVGDTIDATKHNENWSKLRKVIMITGYLPEYKLTLCAAKKSRVFTNGHHISVRLCKKGIKATVVISSTVSASGFKEPDTHNDSKQLRLIYIGYIRHAKGMNCLMNLWTLLKQKYPDFIFDLVGNGEMIDRVKGYVSENGLSANVIFHGHVDSRDKMNELLRTDDLFVFPSLSEGSPRVVIEAMAQGIPVMSTPVGSLSSTFKDKETIRFFDFDNAEQALSIIEEYVNDSTDFISQRNKAFEEVKNKYTIEKFLSTVFTYET